MHKTTALTVLALTLFSSAIVLVVPYANAVTGCNSSCYLTANTGIPPSEGTVWVKLDGSQLYSLPHTFPFGNGTTHTLQVMNTTLYSGSTGARYVWTQWAINGVQWSPTTLTTTPVMEANYTNPADICFGGQPCVNPVGALTAQFEKQFQLTLGFVDPTGQAIAAPNSITIRSSASTQTASAYSSQWYTATSWTVTDAAWEMPSGAGMTLGSPTFDLSNGPVTGTVMLKAYPAKLRVVDSGNNPVPGATVTVTFANATSTGFTTDSQGYVDLGHVPLGTYTAKVVNKGQDMGSWSVDATSSSSYVITLSTGGGSTTPIISSIVIITIFGVAMFLLILAIRVRNPSAPPRI